MQLTRVSPAVICIHTSQRRHSLIRQLRRAPLMQAISAPDVGLLAQQWLDQDTQPDTRQEVEQLLRINDLKGLSERFTGRLEFGTAGLRGKMGAGYTRMNHVTVQQTAQGLCAYLQQQCLERLETAGIVVGYDGRHWSREFAELTAAVFISRGVRVHLFSDVVPTPFVAAGVSVLGAAAGVMVTASHNPKEYNGYKVYWGNGCQIIPPHDQGIAAAIEANLQLWPCPANPRHNPLVSDPGDAVTQDYYQRLATQLHFNLDAMNVSARQVVYTPLHGVGAKAVQQAFQVLHLPNPYIVPEQHHPDPEFPTVVFPNPEEGKGTWALAFRSGEQQGAQYVMANDPDADRLSVAERNLGVAGGWQVFSGNEIGALLAHWVWTNFRTRNPKVPPERCAMLASTVSSKMLGAMACHEGFRFEETLTGFKWLGNRALQLEQEGYHVLFAFEEAIGFMLGGMYKDKDGVSAAAAFAELAAHTYSTGSTLGALLQQLYAKYGYFNYRAGYFVVDDPAKSRAVFKALRKDGQYCRSLAGVAVQSVRDLGTGMDTGQPDGTAILPWSAGDMMITYSLEGGATLTLRASGTEPKLKYYLEVCGADAESAARLADTLAGAVAEDLIGVTRFGLKQPEVQ